MVDPLHPSKKNTLHQTNLIVNVLYWNVMGSIMSMCLVSLQMMHERVSDGTTHSPNMLWDYGMLLLCILFFLLGMLVPFWVVTPLYASGLLIFALVYLAYCLYHMWSESRHIAVSSQLYPSR